MALPVVERVITQERITLYAHVSGDHNPLHLDAEFASRSQFGGVVAHGMLTLAFISEMMTRAFGQRWLESGRLKVRLKAPAYPADVVRTWGEVVGAREVVTDDGEEQDHLVECSVGLSNSRGEELISGAAFVRLSARQVTEE